MCVCACSFSFNQSFNAVANPMVTFGFEIEAVGARDMEKKALDTFQTPYQLRWTLCRERALARHPRRHAVRGKLGQQINGVTPQPTAGDCLSLTTISEHEYRYDQHHVVASMKNGFTLGETVTRGGQECVADLDDCLSVTMISTFEYCSDQDQNAPSRTLWQTWVTATVCFQAPSHLNPLFWPDQLAAKKKGRMKEYCGRREWLCFQCSSTVLT